MYVCTTGTPGVCRGKKPPCVRPRFSRIPALRTAARQTGRPRFSQRLCFQTVAQRENNKQYCPDKVRISFKRNMLFVFPLRHHAKTVRIQKKRGTPCRACHAVFISLCYVLLSRADCSAGAHVCASTAVNAYIGVDRVFFAFADCSAGAFVDACSACNAVIADYISHSDVRFNCLMMFQIFPCKITALFETCKL